MGAWAVMHYYQFNIGDYVSHTRHLTVIEDCAYRRLLDAYYLSEKPLAGDIKAIARQIGMREYEQEVEDMLREFFQPCDEGWINGRADKEIAHFKAKLEQASKAGKASAERRINGRSTGVQPTNNQEPITKNQLKEPNGSSPASRTPSQRLLDLFHEKCDYLPKVAVFSEARKRTLQARFKEVMKSEGWEADKTIEWFGEFYGIVNGSRFLTGRAPPGRDGRAFKADWDWIHAPSNFVKIVEGKYTGD